MTPEEFARECAKVYLDAPRKGDGKLACPACGNHLEVELKQHVKDCLFWQLDGRKLSNYTEKGEPK
jgi:hypothetical protein